MHAIYGITQSHISATHELTNQTHCWNVDNVEVQSLTAIITLHLSYDESTI